MQIGGSIIQQIGGTGGRISEKQIAIFVASGQHPQDGSGTFDGDARAVNIVQRLAGLFRHAVHLGLPAGSFQFFGKQGFVVAGGVCGTCIVALFAEMYGFPLTLFLLSGWLSSQFPQVDWLTHDAGHLFEMMFGWRANPHFGPFHIASFALIGGGFWLLSVAWPVLYRAQREGRVAREGPYARIRHPQYVGFFLIMTGFLLQWPPICACCVASRASSNGCCQAFDGIGCWS